MRNKFKMNQNSGHGNENSYHHNTVVTIGSVIGKIALALSVFFIFVQFNLITINLPPLADILQGFLPKNEVPVNRLLLKKGDLLKIIAKDGIPLRATTDNIRGAWNARLKYEEVVTFTGKIKEKGTPVIVNGKLTDGQWLQVFNDAGIEGWVFSGSSERYTPPAMVKPIPLVEMPAKKPLPRVDVVNFNEVPMDKTVAYCNGDAVKFFKTPLGDLKSGFSLGQLYTGDKVVVIARTLEKELMTRRGVSEYHYRYKIPFTDDTGKNGFAWIKGIWLDFIKPDIVNLPEEEVLSPTKDISSVEINLNEPKLQWKLADKSTVYIYTDEKFGALETFAKSSIYTHDIQGAISLEVCTDESGRVKNIINNDPNQPPEIREFAGTMTKMLQQFEFENTACGTVVVQIYQES